MSEIDDPYSFNMENPFTYQYFLKQIEFYGKVEPKKFDNCEFDLVTHSGKLRDYFNRNWYEIGIPIPRLVIDGATFMSITPMESQSMYMPIYSASYDVYTAGLGLGYFAMKAAVKDEVEKVIVYESNSDIISWFKGQFEHRPELQKIEIRNDDFLSALRTGEIDQDSFIFNDIYQDLNSDEALDHFEEFFPIYQGYLFWGMEALILDSIATFDVEPRCLLRTYVQYLKMWENTTVGEATNDPDDRYKRIYLKQLYEPKWTHNDCERFWEIWSPSL